MTSPSQHHRFRAGAPSRIGTADAVTARATSPRGHRGPLPLRPAPAGPSVEETR